MTSTDTQSWNPEQYARNARFVSDLGQPVLDLLAPQPGERVLDLGCGDGALTCRLHDLGCRVIGADSSPQMVAAAVAQGLDARVMDGQALTFENAFDAVFTNAALHWMPAANKVIAGVRRALVPGGRYVGEFGGSGNVAAIRAAIEAALAARGIAAACPWYFPTPNEYRELLELGGFVVQTIALIPRPTPLPGDVGGWLETFAQPYTSALAAPERPQLIADVIEMLRPALCDEHGKWAADYVRLRFSAFRAEP